MKRKLFMLLLACSMILTACGKGDVDKDGTSSSKVEMTEDNKADVEEKGKCLAEVKDFGTKYNKTLTTAMNIKAGDASWIECYCEDYNIPAHQLSYEIEDIWETIYLNGTEFTRNDFYVDSIDALAELLYKLASAEIKFAFTSDTSANHIKDTVSTMPKETVEDFKNMLQYMQANIKYDDTLFLEANINGEERAISMEIDLGVGESFLAEGSYRVSVEPSGIYDDINESKSFLTMMDSDYILSLDYSKGMCTDDILVNLVK